MRAAGGVGKREAQPLGLGGWARRREQRRERMHTLIERTPRYSNEQSVDGASGPRGDSPCM